jgi:hypothetical protein
MPPPQSACREFRYFYFTPATRRGQLAARADAERGEEIAQVVVDGAAADDHGAGGAEVAAQAADLAGQQ